MAKYIAYYRVSTKGQAQSGLGLDAQKAAVEGYVKMVDGDVVAQFTDIASGGNSERVELAKAFAACRKRKAQLVVARLDRLARDVHFIAEVMKSGVDFIAADMPEANRLTIHVIAAIAEYERQVIAQRTKGALERAKAKGIRLGNPNIEVQQPLAVEAARRRADDFARKMKMAMDAYDPKRALPALRLANILSDEGIKTARGKWWTAAAVIAVRRRISAIEVDAR